MNPASGIESGPILRALAAAGAASAALRRRTIRRRACGYDRNRHLGRLLVLPPDVRALPEPALTRAIIARLKGALRLSLAQRARRDWSYCRHRHTALLAALGGELLRLRNY